jgi:hypothetical protein
MIRVSDIDATFVPERSADVAWVELDGEVVAYHEPTTSTMVLNTTASLLWRLFDGEASLSDLACELAEDYDAPVDAIEIDVVVAVRDLAARRLLAGVELDDRGGEP